jgi:MerR family transcriptional regulator, light-induced transcriptional regulator
MIEQLSHLLSLADTPRYNIKAVVQQTHVNISTLRAWEQRYGVPHPNRSDHGHRLYSQRDIAVIKWLKQCTDEGLAISQAVTMLRESHILEASQAVLPIPTIPQHISSGWPEMRAQLLDALFSINMRQAHLLVNTASTLFSIETVILELFEPIMNTVGERWMRGQICVAEEHLVTNFVRQRLLAFSQLYAPFAHGPRLVCGCVPNEQHEIGLLMFSMLMEQRGWEVIYLGQNLVTEGLVDMLARMTPAILCVGVTLAENVGGVFELARVAEQIDRQYLAFAYSGRVFCDHPELQRRIPGVFLCTDLRQAVVKCDALGEEIDRDRWLSVASMNSSSHGLLRPGSSAR